MWMIRSKRLRKKSPKSELCHSGEEAVSQLIKVPQSRHTGESRYPEFIENTGFRVALRLHGMT